MSDEATPKTIFSGSSSSTDAMLVPSNRDLLLHVRSWGFLEWAGSAGAGKHIHLAPGDRLMLDVQLQPSNRLTQQIPSTDQKAFQGIRDAKDWRNPYLIVRADGIEVAGVTNARSLINVDAATTVLEGLPDSAWPYGRVVAVQESGVLGSESDQSTVEANRSLLVQRLNDLGVIVDFWPPA